MANLKEVKNRIQSVMSTQQITKAMKMVAAAKLRKAQDNIMQMRPYSNKLTAILQNVSSGVESELLNSYTEARPVDKVLIVAVTSDRGLCGGFNSNVFKGVASLIKEKYQQQFDAGQLSVLPIGKKSHDFFKKNGYNIVEGHQTLFTNLSFANARKAAEAAMGAYENKEYDAIELVYNEFKNIGTQILRKEQFLPIIEAEKEVETTATAEVVNDYIFEPSKEVILQELVPKSLKLQFYKAVLESNASEHGARMTAMDKATENAGDLLKELRLSYNRTRQAAITKEILEIVGGAEALAND